MYHRCLLLLLLSIPMGCRAPGPHAASAGRPAPTPEQVVRAYAQAFNDFDLAAFLALQSPTIRKFTRAELVASGGPAAAGTFVVTTSGRDEVARKYERIFASTPRSVRVEVVSDFALDDIVVSRDRVSGFPDGHVADELTLYQVRDGLIQNIWYLGRSR
jgi:hypothetical protein